MASQLSKGTTFVSGGSYDQNDLNNLVDSAIILPGVITEQSADTPDDLDQFLFVDSGTSELRKCSLTQLVSSFPEGGANTVFALRKLGTTAGMAAAGDDSRFPARFTGIRMANNLSADTAATAEDMKFATVTLAASGTNTINWALGNIFFANVAGALTLSHSNAATGRQITVVIALNGQTVNMPAPTLGTLMVAGSGNTLWQFTYTHTPGGITATVFKM